MDTVLGEFLRSRRARLTPAAAGLTDYGDRRRVPGLRREELAQLAGVSVGYYTRLEQGLNHNASESVLDALAAALRLDADERAHLHTLARPRPKAGRRHGPEHLQPHLRSLVSTVNLPALILGRHTHVLAWNPPAHTLLAAHLDFRAPEDPATRPNWARLFFLDPRLRELFGDWADKAKDTVADLRQIAGRDRGDPGLARLIDELTRCSPEFAELWSGHPVRGCASHTREYRHPRVGPLVLADDLLTLPDTDGQRLALFHAEPGSASAAALALLSGTARRAGEVLAV
ncbi:MmyB family transcriptional regulator [Crossiella sp. NPDC003009]